MIDKLNKLRENSSEEGFTLVELMIVVVIIAILAAISIPIFANQQKSALIASVKSDVKNTVTNIATALAKDPTASNIGGYTGSGPSAKITVGSVTADFVISDKNTVITVHDPGVFDAPGRWDSYVVVGWNNSVGTGNYQYDAATGTYKGYGAYA